MMRPLIAAITILGTFALAPAALAQGTGAGSQNFCLKGPGTTMNCKYQTMAACEKDRKGSQQCVANIGTTGSGATSNTTNKK
jgi:hypothetical protein